MGWVLELSQRETLCWRAAHSCQHLARSSSTTSIHRACRKVSYFMTQPCKNMYRWQLLMSSSTVSWVLSVYSEPTHFSPDVGGLGTSQTSGEGGGSQVSPVIPCLSCSPPYWFIHLTFLEVVSSSVMHDLPLAFHHPYLFTRLMQNVLVEKLNQSQKNSLTHMWPCLDKKILPTYHH